MADTYHEKAQKFIKSSKQKGYAVKAEGEELIAYPPGTPKKEPPTPFQIVGGGVRRFGRKMSDTAAKPFVKEAKIGKVKDDKYRQEADDEATGKYKGRMGK